MKRNNLRSHEHAPKRSVSMTAAPLNSIKAKEEAPLPAALSQLSNVLSSAEANQSNLRDRLRRVLESSEGDGYGTAELKPDPSEPHLVVVVGNLIVRVRDLIDSQQDVLSRLHV